MPAPTANVDSYTTSMSTRLSVAAPGLLANDTGGAIDADLVPGSATNGVVAVYADGSFTFDPVPGFVGVASFRYKATNEAEEESNEATVSITVGDCVQWAHLTSGAEGQLGVEGDGRGRTVWQVRADRRNRTASEILASPKLPQRGNPLRRFKLAAGAYTITRSYEIDGEPVSGSIVVVLVEAKQDQNNPWLWTVTVSYEGKEDPTAELPEVSTQESEYQDFRSADIFGRPVANSALDPFAGGMPVDDATDSIVITRNLPFESWNTEIKRAYRNTLNEKPFRLGNQVDEDGNPIDLPPGSVRLKRVTERRMVRSKAATVAAAKFYWQVTAELVVDARTYRTYTTAGLPIETPCHHRWVVADAGFNTLTNGKKSPILVLMHRPTEPQLLNGSGGLLTSPTNAWPAPTTPREAPDICAATNKVYAYPGSGSLTVAAPGLLDDAYSPGGALTAHLVTGSVIGGTLAGDAVNTNGSFVFTKAFGFNGYASFRYVVRAGGNALTDSDPATVVIFCGVVPVMLAFDRYPYADWSPLAALLEGW